MKALIVSLAVLIAFFLGCQNSNTDPVSSDLSGSIGNTADDITVFKDVTSTWPGYINLHHSVYDPSHPMFNSVLVYGAIKYKLELKQSGGNARYANLKVSIYTDAEIRHNCPRQKSAPNVKAFANETVKIAIGVEETYFVEKSFTVRNTCCGPLQMLLRFSVQKDRITLISTTLRPFGGWEVVTYEE